MIQKGTKRIFVKYSPCVKYSPSRLKASLKSASRLAVDFPIINPCVDLHLENLIKHDFNICLHADEATVSYARL